MMRKIFLITGIVLSIFVLMIIFISRNPDRLKPLITAQFEKYTNCEINIDDHLSFSFFPYFGVKAKHIKITTPKGSPTPAITVDIRNAVAQLKLLPFLHGKVETGIIQIDQLRLNQRAPCLTMKLNNARLKISATDESGHSFLTMLSFNFAGDGFPLSGEAVISGNATVDLRQQTASWKNIHATVSGLSLNGELNAKNILDNPDISGHFSLHSPNLKNTLGRINLAALKTENIPDIYDVNADIDLFANNESFSIQSNFYIKNIQASKVNINDINARLLFKNNILNLQSMNANVFGGYVNAEASIDLNAYRPIISAHVKALNVQIEPLFKLLQASNANIYPDTNMSGSGNLELDVSTIVGEGITILNNLNGTAHLGISNGLLMGKDWDDFVNQLAASNQVLASEGISQNLRVFRFKQLSASFKIDNGILFGDDLLIDSADISIKGKGQINLPNNFIDYVLQAALAYNGIENSSAKENLATVSIRSNWD